eukprot:5035503-Alexandrium_andersonii.AAC.1
MPHLLPSHGGGSQGVPLTSGAVAVRKAQWLGLDGSRGSARHALGARSTPRRDRSPQADTLGMPP